MPPRLSSGFSADFPATVGLNAVAGSTFRRSRSKEPKRDPSHRLRTVIGVALIGLMLAVGIWHWWPSTSSVRERAPLDVLLITIDTLRGDALGAYGNRRTYTPAINRLAAAGARFTDAHAHNVTTLPSHANILSGKYPTAHDVRDN